MKLRLKSSKMPSREEIIRMHRENAVEYAKFLKEHPVQEVRVRKEGRINASKMRPAWHFSADFGFGCLSAGYTEYLARYGKTIDDPWLWLKHRLRLRSRGLRLKNRKPRLRLRRR